MRTLFSFPVLFFGILFFFVFVPLSNVLATSCGVGGTCQTASCSGTLIPEGGTPVCSTAPDLTCCKPTSPSPTPLTCLAGFEIKSGVCFPVAASIGLSGMPVLELITRVMNWLLGILGVLAVIAFVISGTQYLVSAGDEDMAETAKRNMTYAVVGLVIALAGLIIVNAIAGLTGAGGVTNY